MVIPLGGSEGQKMLKIVKEGESKFSRTEHGAFVFVPLLKGKSGENK